MCFLINFFFGCAGSPLLYMDFLWLRQAEGHCICSAWACPVAEHRLEGAASVAVAHRLSLPAACGGFPDQGWNPGPLHWQANSASGPPGKSCGYVFLLKSVSF